MEELIYQKGVDRGYIEGFKRGHYAGKIETIRNLVTLPYLEITEEELEDAQSLNC